MSKLYVDIGSTYFKVKDGENIEQYFRNFDRNILDDVKQKCANKIEKYKKEEIFICSSANGGLSTLIIGLTNSYSLKYATNIAYNSGINIIDTILYPNLKEYSLPTELIDVVIVVGGIDDIENVFEDDLFSYINNLNYSNILYAGSEKDVPKFEKNIKDIKILPNIITDKLHVNEKELKEYLTNLYQADIVGKEDIKDLYQITSNQIFSTPYIVNQTLPLLSEKFGDVVDPFILVDIGGATTDIHYSTDLVDDNMVLEGGYDRLVFKKLGVYKSRESLVFSAKKNEFVYELLNLLNVTENILEEHSTEATKFLMKLSIFLVLFKVSSKHDEYIKLKLDRLKSIVFTGGITKILEKSDIEEVLEFLYKKIFSLNSVPLVVVDTNYEIWTVGRS